ncbi:MAG: RecX family transcriptional regulator [Bacteroidota bacterium]
MSRLNPNDLTIAKTFCRGKFYNNKWGRKKISYALKTKEISPSDIEIGFSEINEADYLSTLALLIEKKKKGFKNLEPFVLKKKLYAYAVSKGYEPALVLSLID